MELRRDVHRKGRIEKWVELGMMQRVEQVRNIAEMLTAYMDDLSDHQMEIESYLENLSGMTEEIQDKIEETMDLIQAEILSSENDKAVKNEETLPF